MLQASGTEPSDWLCAARRSGKGGRVSLAHCGIALPFGRKRRMLENSWALSAQ